MLTGAAAAFAAGAAGSQNGNLQIVVLEFTTVSEAVTAVSSKGQTGFTIGDFSTGVATLTMPAHFAHMVGLGFVNADSATASSRQELLVNTVAEASGTANLRCIDAASGATEAIADGTYSLLLFCVGK